MSVKESEYPSVDVRSRSNDADRQNIEKRDQRLQTSTGEQVGSLAPFNTQDGLDVHAESHEYEATERLSHEPHVPFWALANRMTNWGRERIRAGRLA
jgi:hypothetical protein